MNAVRSIGGACRHLVQEDHVALPLLDLHGVTRQGRNPRGQTGQLVVMGGEQRPAAVDLVQVLDTGPGDRQSVKGRRAAADLVQNDQRALGGLIEDDRGLDHFDHEGRAAAGQVVGRADPTETAGR